MLRDTLAWFFRSVNAGLVGAGNPLWFKVLKGFQRVSRIPLKQWKYPQGQWLTVTNFDSTISIVVDPSRPIGAAIYWTGFHEFRELLFLHRFLTAEMVLVDAGANLGEFTLFAAKRLTAGRVVAYEPLPKMVEVLKRSVELNRFMTVTVVQCGLAEVAKNVPLFSPASDDDNEGLATLFPESSSADSFIIELRTLDEEAARLGLTRLDMITMDIEGAELSALKGAEQVLNKFKPLVIVEINSKTFATAGYTVETILEFFKGHRYAPFELTKHGELRSVAVLPQFGNIIFKSI